MNLEKLTPAPWSHVPKTDTLHLDGDGLIGFADLIGPKGGSYRGVPFKFSNDDAAFIALARNAFDVMMRRGVDWIFLERDSNGKIMADCPDYGWVPGRWENPYSAWVEADRWYRENVEQ